MKPEMTARIIVLPKIVDQRGNLSFILHNGTEEIKFSLNRSYFGLYIPKLIWRKLENFSTNSLALIMTSTDYIESDYIRDFNEFISLL